MATFETFLKYFGVAMPFCYVILGGYVLGKYQNFFTLPPNYAIALGCTLILYGIFRCYRAYQRSFKNKS
jgi:hypothetical protein